jgi:diaminopimelate epimerase
MITFVKAHAYGNDFLYVSRALVGHAALPVLAREMCDRHAGVGADGLILFELTEDGATMTLFNADGSVAEVSGNGVRGLAALLGRDHPRDELVVRTDAGAKRLTRISAEGLRQTFRAEMGVPTALRRAPLAVGNETIDAVLLSMGNPHCVLLGALPAGERFRQLGAAIEHHPMFPDGTNVEFVEVQAPDRVRVLIWERGCGATESSGTGSCAAAVAASAYGGASREVDVIAPGGAQRVEWLEGGVYLTGWAEIVFEGEWFRQMPTQLGIRG